MKAIETTTPMCNRSNEKPSGHPMDFIGPFTPAAARTDNKYILVTTDYCINWVQAKPLWNNTATLTTKFLYEHI